MDAINCRMPTAVWTPKSKNDANTKDARNKREIISSRRKATIVETLKNSKKWQSNSACQGSQEHWGGGG